MGLERYYPALIFEYGCELSQHVFLCKNFASPPIDEWSDLDGSNAEKCGRSGMGSYDFYFQKPVALTRY